MKMEDEFDVEIPAEELEDVATFEDVLNYLKAKVQKNNSHQKQTCLYTRFAQRRLVDDRLAASFSIEEQTMATVKE